MSIENVLQQGHVIHAFVKWPEKPDGDTEWITSDDLIATVEADATDSTKCTINADDDDCGEVAIYATAEFGGKKKTAICDLHVIDGEEEAGTITLA